MPSRPIRLASLAATALLLCSCSKAGDHASGAQEERDASSAPDISPTAAPGVAFNYAYEFSLPDKRIAAAQEAHASACEKLSLARCRITGMTYTVDQNEQVTAELDLKLDPSIARQFGKSAQQLVESNDGKLFRLAIGSSDEGQVIDQATKQKSSVSAQIARLEQELAKTKPGTEARASLMSQIQALQQQVSEQTRAIEFEPGDTRQHADGIPLLRPRRRSWLQRQSGARSVADIRHDNCLVGENSSPGPRGARSRRPPPCGACRPVANSADARGPPLG